jgi:RimJ/RimL family protein N-acetyltransferase
MGSFTKFKGLTLEESFRLSLRVKQLDVSEYYNLECRVAGLWLLSINEWLELMMNMRESNREMYFSRFPPSIDSLSKYLLSGPLRDENQILFLLLDEDRNLLGHVGLKLAPGGNAEVDNVLRTSRKFPGVMKIAIDAVMLWGNSNLGIKEYSLKVISTNDRAINLYEELGFTIKERRSLRVDSHPNELTKLTPVSKEKSNTQEEMLIMGKVYWLNGCID